MLASFVDGSKKADGPLLEGQIGGHEHRFLFVATTDNLKEEIDGDQLETCVGAETTFEGAGGLPACRPGRCSEGGARMVDVFLVLYATNIIGITAPRFGVLIAVQALAAVAVDRVMWRIAHPPWWPRSASVILRDNTTAIGNSAKNRNVAVTNGLRPTRSATCAAGM